MRRTACLIASFALLVDADTNHTIDDFRKDRIQYVPLASWKAVSEASTTGDRYAQTTTFTESQGAYAVFKFRGSAIYYGGYGEGGSNALAPGAEKPGTISVQLDDATVNVPGNINLQHPAQQILFSKTGLDPTIEHTIIILKTSETGNTRGLNIDFFTYTVPEGMNDTDSVVSSAAATDNVPAAPTDKAAVPPGVIIGGVFGGIIIAGLLVVLTLWYLKRRRRRRDRRDMTFKWKSKYRGDSDPFMAVQSSEYFSTPSSLPSGYPSPFRASPSSSYFTHSSASSPSVTARGYGPSNCSVSTATGETSLSPNTTPDTGVFGPGITSTSSSPILPQGEPPPPC